MNEETQKIKELMQEIPLVQWMGDPVESMPSVESLLMADTCKYPDHVEERALCFYDGDQWEPHVKLDRQNKGRPALVVNRLPLLVAAAIDASMKTPFGMPMTEIRLTRLKIVLTKRNEDAQRLHNFICSAVAEIMTANVEMVGKQIVAGE